MNNTGLQTLDHSEKCREELAKKEITKEGLIKMQEYSKLILKAENVDGVLIYDKPVFAQITAARKLLKSSVSTIKNVYKEDRDILNIEVKKNLDEEKELIALILPTKLHLEAEEDKVEKIKNEIEEAKEKAAQQLLEDRITKLIKVGGSYAPNTVVAYGINFYFSDLKHQSEETFNAKFEEIKVLHDAAVKKIADEKLFQERKNRLAPLIHLIGALDNITVESTEKEFQDLLTILTKTKLVNDEKQLQIENDNAAKAKELEAVAKEQKEAQDKIDKANQEIQDKREKELLRIFEQREKLILLIDKMRFDGNVFYFMPNPELVPLISKEFVLDASNEAFDSALSKTADAVNKNREDEKLRREEQIKKEAEDKVENDRKAKIEADRVAKEKEARKLARQPDKTKLINFANELSLIDVPELKSPEAKAILDMSKAAFSAMIDKMRELTEKL